MTEVYQYNPIRPIQSYPSWPKNTHREIDLDLARPRSVGMLEDEVRRLLDRVAELERRLAENGIDAQREKE